MKFALIPLFFFFSVLSATGQDTLAYIKIQPDMTTSIKHLELFINGCFISDSTIIKELPQYISKKECSRIQIIPKDIAIRHFTEAQYDILSIRTKHTKKLHKQNMLELIERINIPANLKKSKRIIVSVFRKDAQNGRCNTKGFICAIDNSTKYYYRTKNKKLYIVIFINTSA